MQGWSISVIDWMKIIFSTLGDWWKLFWRLFVVREFIHSEDTVLRSDYCCKKSSFSTPEQTLRRSLSQQSCSVRLPERQLLQMHPPLYILWHNSLSISAWNIYYLLDQMPQLLFISFINFVQLLFESGDYSRVTFSSLIKSLHWHRREWSNIEWLLGRQENLLVVADWFTSLFWVCFISSRRVFACARATQVFVTATVATIRERHLIHSARVEVRLLFESSY